MSTSMKVRIGRSSYEAVARSEPTLHGVQIEYFRIGYWSALSALVPKQNRINGYALNELRSIP